MEGAKIAKLGMTEQFNHKNRLQEHAQRSAVPLPMYQTVSEGPPHALQFKSTVVVDGETFVSTSTFAHRKEAEQDVARAALEGISHKIKHEGVPLIKNDTVFCKSILHEYAVKMQIEKPIYTTAESKGLFPLFITSVAFSGETYTGGIGKNKKEAEQIAARTVIESLLGSDTGTIMSQIIKSKGRLYTAIHEGNGSCIMQGTENHSTNSIIQAKEVQSALANDKLPAVTHAGTLTSGQPAKAATVASCPTDAKKPKEEVCEFYESSGNDTSLPALPQGDPPAGSTVLNESPNESQSMANNSGRKRSNKRSRTLSKKARTDKQSPVQ